MRPANRKAAFRRFWGDESGQGIIFAAATLLLLIGFVAFVFNIGRLLDRRTKIQLGADSAVYAGAVVEGNSLSAIGWINSAMAQIYYRSLKYAVDVNVAGVAAELERRMNPNGAPGGPAWDAYQTAYSQAQTNLPLAKQWMVDLSQIENAIAILTPRLMEEEMYAVAGEVGAERISVYPSFRMFPHASSSSSYRIECLANNGWSITNITPGGNGDSISITLNGNTWDLQYSQGGLVKQDVQITQDPQDNPPQWDIEYFQPPGSLIQQVKLVHDPNLGWIVMGTAQGQGGGPPTPIPTMQFQTVPVQTPEGATVNGTLVTQGSTSQVLWMGQDGNLYACHLDSNLKSWVVTLPSLTNSQTTIGGVNVRVNVTNRINFPGGSAQIGNPTTVDIGPTHIVLSNPPVISTWLDQIRISINGFTPNSLNISSDGFSLTPGDADGKWRKYFNPIEELWSRHWLVQQVPIEGALDQWQYDRQRTGSALLPESNITNRFLNAHVFGDDPARHPPNQSQPVWTAWFDPTPAVAGPMPNNISNPYLSGFTQITRPDGSWFFQITPANLTAIKAVYYQTQYTCPICNGMGGSWQNGNWVVCPACNGRDWDGDGKTDARVFIADFMNSPIALSELGMQRQFPDTYYANAPIFKTTVNTMYGNTFSTIAQLPLVLADPFFQYGVNVGAWKHAYNGVMNPNDTLMLFPNSREPAWGTVAIASARVGIKQSTTPGDYRYNFSIPGGTQLVDDRDYWCANWLQNLYLADVNVKLMPSKELKSDPDHSQVNGYDLDWDIAHDQSTLQGPSLNPIQESATSYLWGAILATRQSYPFQGNDWLDAFNGRADPRVGNALRNMVNRQGATFDYGSSGLDQVVEH